MGIFESTHTPICQNPYPFPWVGVCSGFAESIPIPIPAHKSKGFSQVAEIVPSTHTHVGRDTNLCGYIYTI